MAGAAISARVSRVLVTGAHGSLGRAIVRSLRTDGWPVTATGRRAESGVVELDVTDADAVRRVVTEAAPEVVVHLAGLTPQWRGGAPAADYDRVNHQGLRNVLRAMAGTTAHLVLASSSAVYGDAPRREPLDETANPAPTTAYAKSKLAAERAIADPALGGRAAIILRFPPVYGADQLMLLRRRAYVPLLDRRLLIAMIGRQPYFSMCAIQNAVHALRLAVEGSIPPGTYNVADDRPYSQREVRQVMAALDGVRLTLPLPSAPVRVIAQFAAGIIPSGWGAALVTNVDKLFVGTVLDTTRIRSLGFRPSHDLFDLLRRPMTPRSA